MWHSRHFLTWLSCFALQLVWSNLSYFQKGKFPNVLMMVMVVPISVRHYCLQYFEALDLAVVSIRNRFDQPGYAVYCKLGELLLKEAAGSNFSEQLREVSGIYHEIDASQLEVQLSNMATYFCTCYSQGLFG